MTLRPHTIVSALGARHRHKVVGRGNASGHGTYSGRGGKGQTARSGGTRGLRMKGFKDLMQSTPKLPGFKSFAVKPAPVRLKDLESKFDAGAEVTLQALKDKKIISINTKAAKILNTGELNKKLSVVGIACSAGAKEKIEKAGGSIK